MRFDAQPLTIPALLAERAATSPTVAAIRAGDGTSLTYAELAKQVAQQAEALVSLGVSLHDPVLVDAANTVESVLALLAAMSVAIAVPINPGGDKSERALLLERTHARALYESRDGRWLTVGISSGAGPASVARPRSPTPADTTIMLPTSGTASAPRLVMLTHEQWIAGANRVVRHYGLGADDRVVNVMPLYHNHGFNGCVGASLVAGGQVMCPGSTNYASLGGWFAQFRPTWHTAAPTVHHALLDAIQSSPELTDSLCLRFVRSTSAPLPDALRNDMMRVLGVPVVQAWALTEAAGEVTAESIPARPPWSVGEARHGFTLDVIDSNGELCPPGMPGEIVVRGGLLSSGYLNDDEANREVFRHDGLHSRDIGTVDVRGRVTIHGRSGDFVNVGGEMVWLPAVDDAVRTHPAIDEALAFSIPHPRLGEAIGVAVTVREGASIDSASVRNYLRGRLPRSSIPHQVDIVRNLPISALGKGQRWRLTQQYAPAHAQDARDRPQVDSGRSPMAVVLAALWCDVLGLEHIDDDEDFITAGGDSLLATKLVAAVGAVTGVELKIDSPLDKANTVRAMVAEVNSRKLAGQ